MKLEGSLDAFSLPDIFALLSMTKKTGGLHLRRDTAHGVVWFTTGALTGGASDASAHSLARRLVGGGHVTDDSLQAAIDVVLNDDNVGIGRALQQGGAIDEGVLHDVVAEHIVDTVFDLLRWPDGDFAFVVDEANPDDVGVSRQADDVVTEARRRLESWGSVAATVPSPQTVLSLAANPMDDPQLSRDEWGLLALVDGRRTVGEIVALCGRGDYAVVSALAELVGRGLLRTDESDGVAALIRRHELLARLGGNPPAEATSSVASPQPSDVGTEDLDDEVEDEDDDDEPAPAAKRIAAAKPLASVHDPVEPVVPAQPSPSGEVTPRRPEPFLPRRAVEHAESLPGPVAAVVGGSAAPAPAPASYIERDPSVNKSLLLRLIAGVRGL